MAYSLKNGGLSVAMSSFNETPLMSSRTRRIFLEQKSFPILKTGYLGKPLIVQNHHKGLKAWNAKVPIFNFQANLIIKAHKWWEKSLQPNMVEIRSAQHLVDSLQVAGDRLTIVDFYSPACGGCRALHPKICQLAELHPNAVFLKVNQEELKTMCDCLNIHVLPFFRFYRGAEGRVCSFSCTNATIKKFKDALAKYGTERCSLGPVKGLDQAELDRLVSCGLLPMNLIQQLTPIKEECASDLVMNNRPSLSHIKEESANDLVINQIELSCVLSKAGK